MNYDLVVKNGTVIDGSGGARYRADLGTVSYTHLTLPTKRIV